MEAGMFPMQEADTGLPNDHLDEGEDATWMPVAKPPFDGMSLISSITAGTVPMCIAVTHPSNVCSHSINMVLSPPVHQHMHGVCIALSMPCSNRRANSSVIAPTSQQCRNRRCSLNKGWFFKWGHTGTRMLSMCKCS